MTGRIIDQTCGCKVEIVGTEWNEIKKKQVTKYKMIQPCLAHWMKDPEVKL